jgi:hypothetical protein
MTSTLPASSLKCRGSRPPAVTQQRPSGRSHSTRNDRSTITSPTTRSRTQISPGIHGADQPATEHNHSPPQALTSGPVQISGTAPVGWPWTSVVPNGIGPRAAEMNEKTLSFEELRHWLLAKVSHPVSVQVVGPREIVAFLEGPIDRGDEVREHRDRTVFSLTAPPAHGRCSWPSPSSFLRPSLPFPTASLGSRRATTWSSSIRAPTHNRDAETRLSAPSIARSSSCSADASARADAV